MSLNCALKYEAHELGGWATRLPLHNLQALTKRASAPVLVVGNVLDVSPAQLFYPQFVVVTCNGDINDTNWLPLNKRSVAIAVWCSRERGKLEELLLRYDVSSIRKIHTEAFGAVAGFQDMADKGWNQEDVQRIEPLRMFDIKNSSIQLPFHLINSLCLV